MWIVVIFCGEQAARSLFMYLPHASRPLCYSCDATIPIFSQMCPCSLLASVQVSLGGAHFIHPQYRHAMSNTPFHELIWLRTYSLCSCTLLFSRTLCRLSYLFLIDTHLLPPWYAHIAAVAIIICQSLAPFVPTHFICFSLTYLALILVSSLTHFNSIQALLSGLLVPGRWIWRGWPWAVVLQWFLCCVYLRYQTTDHMLFLHSGII